MQKGDEFIGLNAGHKGAPGILFKHDLVGDWLTIDFHQIERAVGHVPPPVADRGDSIRAAMSLI
jgi:hypothetical protein